MYDVIDIAEYILNYCEENYHAITNLQLQKFLYYIQGKCIAKTGNSLFKNKLEAWRYGPVVPDAYFWFNDNMSEPITGIKSKINLNKQEEKIIHEVISEKIIFSPWELVENTHKEGPWKDNYSEGMNYEISIYDLIKYKSIFD